MGLPPVTKASPPNLLYVDGLNYMKHFMGLEVNNTSIDVSSLDFESCLRSLEQTTKQFMQEARTAGWKVSIFLDNCKHDPEEVIKYWTRGQSSVAEGGSTCIPPSTTLLLGNAFKRAGAQVHYSWASDNDPTMAAHAHLDDAAVLSRDGDFMRYYGKKATGETYFLQKLFSNFSTGDARNGGSIALWRKRIPTERYTKDWVLTTGVGEVKGGRIPFLAHRPTVTPEYLLITERDGDIPHKRVTNPSAFPFAFPCALSCDPVVLLRPLRLAVYQIMGEHTVRETTLRWVDDRDGKVVERQKHQWTLNRTGWERKEVRDDAEEEEEEVVDSWEDLDSDDGAKELDSDQEQNNLTQTEETRLKFLLSLLSKPPPASFPKLSQTLLDTYILIFGEDDTGMAPSVSNPATGENVAITPLHRRNEHTCRFLSMATFVAACWKPVVHDSMADLVHAFHVDRERASLRPK